MVKSWLSGSGLSPPLSTRVCLSQTGAPAISGLLNCGEGDEPKLHLQDFAFGEIHLAVTSIDVATELFKPLKRAFRSCR